ncbi:DivIVA domain-containing protein [Streptomyces ficellus]|uniref:DivIVA domain-containing protein n=1 Tax=Streptomyces ficellus TaxID=1977088 RepID=A0A6I6F3Y9_9ACTN|nr:DivIVA domain-containing protein [Streptomyces ficellus]QGV78733.1 DivIVA domain-containing protein [Streptomyces ficellus]
MFWFLALAMVVVVAAVTLAVIGGGESEVLPEVPAEHTVDQLPLTRPVDRADVDALRLPLAPRGYRMAEVDDALGRLGAELAERDARIAELQAALEDARAGAPAGRAAGDAPGGAGHDAYDDGDAYDQDPYDEEPYDGDADGGERGR